MIFWTHIVKTSLNFEAQCTRKPTYRQKVYDIYPANYEHFPLQLWLTSLMWERIDFPVVVGIDHHAWWSVMYAY